MTNAFAAILFDLDGTLLDSARDLHECLNKLCHAYQKPAVELIAVQQHLNQGAAGFIRLAFGTDLSATEEQNLRQQFLHDYAEMQDSRPVHFFAGTLPLLHALHAQHIPVGIVTNKFSRFTVPILKNVKLLDQMQAVICGDQVQQAKPAAEPLLTACAQMGVDPKKCCYVGDNRVDMESAQAARMPGFLACWGYWPRLRYSIEGWPYHEIFYTPEALLSSICPDKSF